MQEIINNLIANLVSAERYKVARPYADRILRMFAVTLLAGESPMLAARSAVCNWYWHVKNGRVPEPEIAGVRDQLILITAAIRIDCARKAQEAYKEAQADDGN